MSGGRANTAVLLVDRDGRIARAYGACEGLLGCVCQRLVGRSVEALGPEAAALVRGTFVETQELREGEALLALRPGESRAVLVTVAPPADDAPAIVVVRPTSAIERVASIDDVLDRVTDGFVAYDRDWRFTYLNPAAEQYFQRRREELLGRVVWDVFPQAIGTEAERALRAAASDRAPREFELLAPAQKRRVAFRVFPSAHGIAVYFRDVTEQRAAEAALRESEDRYRSLFEHAMDGMMLTSPEGGILSSNPAACQMLGRTDEEIRAVGRAGVVADDPRLAALVKERDRTGHTRGEVDMVRRDGTRFPVEISSSVFVDSAGLRRTSLSFRDLTERKRAEEQLRAAAAENARLYREAIEAKRRREEVLGVVSHDLRNPLNAIALNASLLARRTDAEEARAIVLAVKRAETLIRDLLLAATVEAGGMALARRPEDARAIVEEAVDLHRAEARERSITLEAGFAGSAPPIFADRHRVAQALGNLLGNALKFTPAGGRVRVDVRAEDGHVAIAVSDTGPGIPVDQQAKVFDRYWQGAAGRRADAGLGLYIVKGIVEAHGGTIRVASTPGLGATFTITLPACAAEPA